MRWPLRGPVALLCGLCASLCVLCVPYVVTAVQSQIGLTRPLGSYYNGVTYGD